MIILLILPRMEWTWDGHGAGLSANVTESINSNSKTYTNTNANIDIITDTNIDTTLAPATISRASHCALPSGNYIEQVVTTKADQIL